ncbi:MAG: hypothetical protein ACJ72G_15250 [Friedmanniella sp.]
MQVRTRSAAPTSLTFLAAAAGLLPKAQASGDRLVTALYLILVAHTAVSVTDADGRQYLTCAECRPGLREPGCQYPCPTAQQAYWALDAVLP